MNLQQVSVQFGSLVFCFRLLEKLEGGDAGVVLLDPHQSLVAHQLPMGRAQYRLVNRTEMIVVDHVWSPGYFGSAIDASGKSDYAAHGQEPLYCQCSGHPGLLKKVSELAD